MKAEPRHHHAVDNANDEYHHVGAQDIVVAKKNSLLNQGSSYV